MTSWVDRPDGWFGGSKNRPTNDTLRLAAAVLDHLGAEDPIPVARPTEDGGVVLEWHHASDRTYELEVCPDGSILIVVDGPADVDVREVEDVRDQLVADFLRQVREAA